MSFTRIEVVKIVSKEFIAEYRDLNAAKPNEAKMAVCTQFESQIDKIDDSKDVFKLIEDLCIASTREQIKHHWGLPFNIKLHNPDSTLGLTLHAIRSFVIEQMKDTVDFERYVAEKHTSYYQDIANIDEQFAEFQLANKAKHVPESLTKAEEEFYLRRAALGDVRFILRAGRNGYLSCWNRPSRSAIQDSSEPKVLSDKVISASKTTPTKEQLLSPVSPPSLSVSPMSTPSTPTRQLALASPVSSPATPSISRRVSFGEIKDTKYTPAQFSTHIPYTFTPEFHRWFYESHIQHNAVAKQLGEDKIQKLEGHNKFVENATSGARQKAREIIKAARLAAKAEEANKPSFWSQVKSAISPGKNTQVDANGESKRADHLPAAAAASRPEPTASGPSTPTKTPSPRHSFASFSAADTQPQHQRGESTDGAVKDLLKPWT